MTPQRRSALVSVVAAAALVLLKLGVGPRDTQPRSDLGGRALGHRSRRRAADVLRRARRRPARRRHASVRPRQGRASLGARRGGGARPRQHLHLRARDRTADRGDERRGADRLVRVRRARDRDRDRREPHDDLVAHRAPLRQRRARLERPPLRQRPRRLGRGADRPRVRAHPGTRTATRSRPSSSACSCCWRPRA